MDGMGRRKCMQIERGNKIPRLKTAIAVLHRLRSFATSRDTDTSSRVARRWQRQVRRLFQAEISARPKQDFIGSRRSRLIVERFDRHDNSRSRLGGTQRHSKVQNAVSTYFGFDLYGLQSAAPLLLHGTFGL
jgi:hypothetical protein